jgi:hypothetical protein
MTTLEMTPGTSARCAPRKTIQSQLGDGRRENAIQSQLGDGRGENAIQSQFAILLIQKR